MRKRRGVEEFSVSFLDVICCGFGAIILLLMLTKTFQPEVLEVSSVDLTEQVQQREAALFEIRGKISELRRQIQLENSDLQSKLVELAELQTQLTKVLGGISVDSEYIIFVIDTSGSMQSAAWGQAVQKVSETLAIYPNVKGIQVMNDMGDYMFPAFARQWIEDSPSRRSNIVNTLRNWAPFSNSSPVEGIEEAVSAFYDPNKRISVYVFGDDYTGTSIEEVVEAVDRINLADESGRRRVRIHAVGFPVFLDRPNARTFRFAALMRELAYRNDGTFVGLTQYQ